MWIDPVPVPVPEFLGENLERKARRIERKRARSYAKAGWEKRISANGVSYWVPTSAAVVRSGDFPPPLKIDLAPSINAALNPATLDIQRTMSGLGFPILDVLSPVTGLVTSFVTTKSNEKIAKQEEKIEKLRIKGENEQAAREFALLQAMKQIEPEEKARNSQLLALWAVGGVAALVSTYLLVSMARSRK